MTKKILGVTLSLILLWLCWQGIDFISSAIGPGAIDVLLSLALIVAAGLFSLVFGGFLARKIIDYDLAHGNL